MKPLFFPDDHQFEFEAVRALGATAYGAADVGEVVTTAQRITAGDYDSWHDEWLAMGDRVAAEAEAAAKAGHPVSARDGWMRASTYYRNAEFFLHGDPSDPRIDHAYFRSVETFRAAAPLLSTPAEHVQIPYEGTVLHGYLYRAESPDGPRPTVIAHTGFDGTAEEMHVFGGAAGPERGYHVLTFDGPGQGAAIHRDGLVFRPDWENVIGPVLDWLVDQPGVDPDRIALLGESMGGVLAPRAAAFEPRLAACVAVDGIYDFGESLATMMGQDRDTAFGALTAPEAPELDAALDRLRATNPTLRWATDHGRYVMGKATSREFLAHYFEYNLRDGLAERVTCPTLVCDAEADGFFNGQPDQLFAHLTCETKALIRFTEAEGAGAHCHVGGQRLNFARVFDWLDDVLR